MAPQRNFPIIPDVSRAVAGEFRTLRSMIYDGQQQVEGVLAQIQNLKQTGGAGGAGGAGGGTGKGSNGAGGSSVTNVTVTGAVTSADGANPNVTQLIGLLAQAQRAYIPEYSTLPSLQDPISQDGALISVNGILYRFEGIPQPGQWVPQTALGAVIIATHLQRIANYPPASNPVGGLLYESDTTLLLINSGTQWLTVGGEIRNTHANRLSAYPSVFWSVGTFYYETNRNSTYEVKNAVGTVTVAGGVNVTWVSGDHFINTGTGFTASQWTGGTVITIDGVDCVIATVNSPTSITLAAATTNAVGVSYLVKSGRWVWREGIMAGTLAVPSTTVPSDLGENDNGFELNATDYYHLYRWTGSAWTWGPGDGANGGDIVISAGTKTPAISAGTQVGAWKLLDGTGDDCVNPVGVGNPVTYAGENTGLVYLTRFDDCQDLFFKGQSAFDGIAHAATVPTIGGRTENAPAGVNSGTGTFTPLVAGTTALTPTLNDPGHNHNLTSTNAPITLPADPVRWMGGKPYLRR